ncbi:hypothetical protein HBN50_00650 [Halobacteriovorax sp. GB3]|uniref:GHMP family kinase ATP-binding protein n=1 Tax=Halobacteriovorax sp. GB3 TaxID=2719615 RepID=UPI00235F4C62|nr:hypothetical protein [Halobacteriovorax sp. GB3]MDD0851575.1 hypothetical protein [Halobacteriovorax sp. GB3]
MVKVSGSVRVDLLGGTLDLKPINLILPNVLTLNLATSLKAEVEIEKSGNDQLKIISLDYDSEFDYKLSDLSQENFQSDFFGPMNFVCQIINEFSPKEGLMIKLKSGSPAGAGLGGSSSMGVTLYKALSEYFNKSVDRVSAINTVNDIEARILDSGPAGYQDYYPALFGGVLALRPNYSKIDVEQLYSDELVKELESSLTLVYSGQTRLSGINNWEVYKSFFDKDENVREGLGEIARLTSEAYKAIKEKRFSDLITLIGKEGEQREKLFSGIVSPEMKSLYQEIKEEVGELGMKACGAGGGGCFLLIHSKKNQEKVRTLVIEKGMSVLDFSVDAPVEA